MRHRLVKALQALPLARGHYALFGSGPLLVRGWIDSVGDLDVIARGPAWASALEMGRLVHLPEHGIDVVQVGDEITIGNTWAIGDFDPDNLIDTAELVDGVPCVLLEHVVAYKRLAGRPKDAVHLAIIEAHRGA